ncbi:class I SAM-dependent methyltransferase [Paenibacillus vulneris]|uniref:Class I SAM-dependent methyltransferase n=1 Tax=Paenibacillus vulneris TaxID=1133364 RepID=A0ABW3UUR0_9BACL
MKAQILLNNGLLRSVASIYAWQEGLQLNGTSGLLEENKQVLLAHRIVSEDLKLLDKRFGYTCYEHYRQNLEPEYFDTLLMKESIHRESILDLCCGGGATIRALLNHEPRIIYGIDSDAEQLQLLQSVYSSMRGMNTQLVTKVSDAHSIPLDNECVDMAVCRVALHYLNENLVLTDIYRILRPHGKLFLLVHGIGYIYHYLFTRKRIFSKQMIHFLYNHGVRRNPISHSLNQRSSAKVLTIRQVKRLLADSGFVNVQAYTHSSMMILGKLPVYFAVVAEKSRTKDTR